MPWSGFDVAEEEVSPEDRKRFWRIVRHLFDTVFCWQLSLIVAILESFEGFLIERCSFDVRNNLRRISSIPRNLVNPSLIEMWSDENDCAVILLRSHFASSYRKPPRRVS